MSGLFGSSPPPIPTAPLPPQLDPKAQAAALAAETTQAQHAAGTGTASNILTSPLGLGSDGSTKNASKLLLG